MFQATSDSEDIYLQYNTKLTIVGVETNGYLCSRGRGIAPSTIELEQATDDEMPACFERCMLLTSRRNLSIPTKPSNANTCSIGIITSVDKEQVYPPDGNGHYGKALRVRHFLGCARHPERGGRGATKVHEENPWINGRAPA